MLSASAAFAQPAPFFAGDDDARWSEFLKAGCTLIENIPIVARLPEVSAADAILSSIVGYYERQLPILGPPRPKRVQQLFSLTASTQRDLSDAGQDALLTALYGLEASTFRSFREVAREHPEETDGAVRSRFLREWDGDTVDKKLQSLARSRFQAVKVERTRGASFEAVKRAVAARRPGLLSVAGGQYAYGVVGFFDRGALAVVINSDAAKPVRVPAERVLLTEQDRRSSGQFASRAREKLKGETLLFDASTHCEERRPAGITFLDPRKLPGTADLYVIQEWSLDTSRMREFVQAQGAIPGK